LKPPAEHDLDSLPGWVIARLGAMAEQVYLDFNATAPMRPEAIEATAAAMAAGGNASSVHATGRAARALVEDARGAVAALVGAPAAGLIFTGSGTEANNQALRCAGRDRALVSAVEHESVLRARDDSEIIPVDGTGRVDLAALESLLGTNPRPAIVSVMLANNETGVIQPVAEVARLAHGHGALVHCDAIQAAGRIPVDMAALGIDLLSISAHKIGGPQGVGALIAREPASVGRLVHGGGQERGRRAGTENVPGIAGFGAAARAALDGLAAFAGLARLRDRLEAGLRAFDTGIAVFGADAPRLPNTSSFAAPGLTSETQVIGLDLAGIAVSAGSACSAGKIEAPYVLLAMGVPDALARCALRVSLGWTTTAADIEALLAAWRSLRRRTHNRAAAV
jgi:cysteine desulfurase